MSNLLSLSVSVSLSSVWSSTAGEKSGKETLTENGAIDLKWLQIKSGAERRGEERAEREREPAGGGRAAGERSAELFCPLWSHRVEIKSPTRKEKKHVT